MKSLLVSKRRFLTGATVALSVVLGQSAFAADDKTQIGMLNCDVDGGIGLLLGSKKKMTCVFKKKDGGTETYTGHVTKIGVDIGITAESHIVWAVLAHAGDEKPGALAGKYDGVTAEATAVAGVGANVLVSAGNAFTLQPFSVSGQTGLNIAGGLAQIELEYTE